MTDRTDDLRRRLAELQAEKAKGEEMLAHLDRERQAMREQILRIDGAIHVLAELVGDAPADGDGAAED